MVLEDGQMSTIFVVDDDHGTRMALSRLLAAASYEVRSFESAESFLREQDATTPGCLLLDICMPGLSGLELQRLLAGSHNARPIIFLTGTDDIQHCVLAMKQGAIDFLMKPIDDMRLFAGVEQAVRLDRAARAEREMQCLIERRLKTLTTRERQVMDGVIRGQLNKQIAADLGNGEKTVKVHRERMMSKMDVSSVAELVRVAIRAGLLDVPEYSFEWQMRARRTSRAAPISASI
jgi:FixJ family two-component response regulator